MSHDVQLLYINIIICQEINKYAIESPIHLHSPNICIQFEMSGSDIQRVGEGQNEMRRVFVF